jgi:hypothetical protein
MSLECSLLYRACSSLGRQLTQWNASAATVAAIQPTASLDRTLRLRCLTQRDDQATAGTVYAKSADWACTGLLSRLACLAVVRPLLTWLSLHLVAQSLTLLAASAAWHCPRRLVQAAGLVVDIEALDLTSTIPAFHCRGCYSRSHAFHAEQLKQWYRSLQGSIPLLVPCCYPGRVDQVTR